MPVWLRESGAIVVLLAAIGLVLWRLPKVDLGHSPAFKRRRFLNWFPLGLSYAFLYMGRYNLTVSQPALAQWMSKADFGDIAAAGTVTYGLAFLINGPLTDRLGGRKTILLSTAGSAVVNLVIAAFTWALTSGRYSPAGGIVPLFALLYAANMYFQSFGAVSIVKVNASWFHVRERGLIGGVFGILIALGIYFAFDWGNAIAKAMPVPWVFVIPALILLVFFLIDLVVIRDTPGELGLRDFDVGDASSGDDGPPLPLRQVAKRMFSNPVIITIAAIEFCSGYLRNGIMSWGDIFRKETGQLDHPVFSHWGLSLCLAGILGGMLAGVISDTVFKSRRGPVSAVLYGGMLIGTAMVFWVLETAGMGWTIALMCLCVIGVHGMLSGTASMDFGGRKNAGVAVGLIDGFVYLGTGAQFLILGRVLPEGDAAKIAANWAPWPWVMLPAAILGFVLALRIWNATPRRAAAPAPVTAPAVGAAK